MARESPPRASGVPPAAGAHRDGRLPDPCSPGPRPGLTAGTRAGELLSQFPEREPKGLGSQACGAGLTGQSRGGSLRWPCPYLRNSAELGEASFPGPHPSQPRHRGPLTGHGLCSPLFSTLSALCRAVEAFARAVTGPRSSWGSRRGVLPPQLLLWPAVLAFTSPASVWVCVSDSSDTRRRFGARPTRGGLVLTGSRLQRCC